MNRICTDDKSLCSGCGTCALVCPKSSITYKRDLIGSLYASIDNSKCIDCGACLKICPIQQSFETNFVGEKAYAAFAKEETIRFRGSSGGMFEVFSEWILNQQGSIFACRFDENLKLRMFEANTAEEVSKLTKSKYLQSESAYIFPTIKERIKQGRTVLVCSTPCQISALKKYLGSLHESENLFLLDFFCHGVPSQEMFDKCISYVEKRDGIMIERYEFRSKKKNGATPHYYTIEYQKNGQNKKTTDIYLNDPFYSSFQKYITLRDSCYNCIYGSGNHCGDITIGDFHDIDKYVRGINRFDGVSTVIVNTSKGQQIWNSIEDSLVVRPMDIEQLVADHQVYSGGTNEPLNRSEFLKDMESIPFDEVVEKWFYQKNKWMKNMYYRFPRIIRDRIKSIVRL